MAVMKRREVVRQLLKDREDLLVVAGLGAPAWDVTAAGDHVLNFPLWGGMGGAIMVGLGLALAQPDKKVLVITGDGELLMGLNSLATVAVANPANLSIVVLDNEVYGETGKQMTHTALGVDLVATAKGCGFSNSFIIPDFVALETLREAVLNPGLVFAQIKVDPSSDDLVLPPRDGALLKNRFREALLGPKCHLLN